MHQNEPPSPIICLERVLMQSLSTKCIVLSIMGHCMVSFCRLVIILITSLLLNARCGPSLGLQVFSHKPKQQMMELSVKSGDQKSDSNLFGKWGVKVPHFMFIDLTIWKISFLKYYFTRMRLYRISFGLRKLLFVLNGSHSTHFSLYFLTWLEENKEPDEADEQITALML